MDGPNLNVGSGPIVFDGNKCEECRAAHIGPNGTNESKHVGDFNMKFKNRKGKNSCGSAVKLSCEEGTRNEEAINMEEEGITNNEKIITFQLGT